MNNNDSRTITIVGGGSSGWMTALYLNTLFNKEQLNYQIRVIESPDIGIIGVGEATVHSVRFFFAAMGLDENELLRETNGSLKLGILFRNWMKPVDGKTHEYFHPFEQQRLGRGMDISSMWHMSGRGTRERYDEAVSLSSELVAHRHVPKTANSQAYQGVVPYGYHIDATLLARFLRRKAVAEGVEHIEATVTSATTEGEMIQSVETDKGSFTADFFIDCTGFRGLLIDQLKQDNWESFADALPCNKAVAIQRELPDDLGAKPYTTATALSNGWAWQIDLQNRQGTGYVYDGNRLSKEEAEQELRDFLGPDAAVLKCAHLNMKVGCRKEFWVGNCVAIGLSAGFIEPLESTGLHLINLGAGLLATHQPNREVDQSIRDSYSRLMRGFYQDLKQFIVLHYCLTDRDDTDFWRAAPATVEHTPWLQSQLQIWKHKICEFHDLAGSFSTTFNDENYRYILYGMHHNPALTQSVDAAASEQLFAQANANAERARQLTSAQGDYLSQLNL
ncbi:tryptophan halogenase [Halioglobus japonicus]|uniref:Tryptophan 7-halogenase n=1 Tax=Halioglobus japonicus TaxID=930805 RepID=A0AAP8SN77_9GAMM|nr:tryptophan halogenase family protein [Halioglobus japonicus]AQA18187.1 tryptophan halogenase [Halioglobus japonicus]PLW86191.1 tryptophan 7-halogenase [Halioglobus japonicus]GHD14006.1 tryptophan halogenase [Halioglobus japonicus]